MRDWLIGYIEQAFRCVKLDDGMTIFEAESMDRYGDQLELDLARSAERTDWRRVPYEHLVARNDGLVFLDAKGFRFYAPAIMTLILRMQDDRGLLTDAFESRLHDIRKSCNVLGVPYTTLFNRSQRAAILRYVKFYIYNVRCGRHDDTLAKTLDGLVRCSMGTSP